MITETKIYTISQLNAKAKMLLEENLPLIWVEGEISNLAKPRSGHMYFSLKDEFAQVRCAMFRQYQSLTCTPQDGTRVLIQAQVSIYEPRGDYQLIVYNMEPAGEGLLRQKFEQLKHKLQTEGLFNLEHKRPLPKLPKQIGVITSPTGAAVHDIINVLKRRNPNIPIIIYPTQVQGQAKEQIVHAINIANQHHKCDVLILARGGGSLEDLWPFNEELVTRAIFNSQIPIISGIGHETDFTIADFVADQRAPTPSAAAELVTPDIQELLKTISYQQHKLQHLMITKIKHLKLYLDNLKHRLQHPGKKLQTYMQHLDSIDQRLSLAIKNILKHKQAALTNLSRALETVSPLATLNRGYAILSKNDNIIKSITDVQQGDKIKAKLKDGEINCLINR